MTACGGGGEVLPRGGETRPPATTTAAETPLSTQTAESSSPSEGTTLTSATGGTTAQSSDATTGSEGSSGTSGTETTGGSVEPLEIVSEPVTEAYPLTPYRYAAQSRGGQGEIRWALDTAPAEMTIDPEGGVIEWTPAQEDLGEHSIVVTATDTLGETAIQSYTLSVFDRAPRIVSEPVTEATVGETYRYPAEATGLPPLTWRLNTAPEGMTIGSENGLVLWRPQTPGTWEVEIEVSNVVEGETLRDTQRFTLTVIAPPEITSTPLEAAVVGAHYIYEPTFVASAPFRWSLPEAPEGMTLDPETGRLFWIPEAAGDFPVTLRLENDYGRFEQSFSIEVLAEFTVSPTRSELEVEEACVTVNGVATSTIRVIPRDDRGARLPPGLDVSIEKTEPGEFTTPVVDVGDGTYTRVFLGGIRFFEVVTITATVTHEGETVQLPSAFIASQPPADPAGGFGGCTEGNQVTVRVLDARNGFAIEEAFVMVGDRPGDPYPGNVRFTDDTGRVRFAGNPLPETYTLTVGAEGFRLFTVNALRARDLVIPLQPAPLTLPERFRVTGGVTAYEDPLTNLGMSFVQRQLSPLSVIAPDLEEILSPLRAELTVTSFDPLDVPGNVAVPLQSLQLLPVEHPYALLLPRGPTNLTALTAIFPYDRVVELVTAFQGGEIDAATFLSMLLDLADYDTVGVYDDLDVTADLSAIDIPSPLTQVVTETLDITVRNKPEVPDILVWSLVADRDARRFVPTGLYYRGDAGDIRATTPSLSGPFADFVYRAAAVATDIDGGLSPATGILSRGFTNRSRSVTFDNFFKVVENMEVEARRLTFSDVENAASDPPSPAPDLNRSLLSVVVDVEDPDTGEATTVVLPRWDLVSPGTTTHFLLPELPTPEEAGGPVPADPLTENTISWQLWITSLDGGGEAFDFDAFAFSSFGKRLTHASAARRLFTP